MVQNQLPQVVAFNSTSQHSIAIGTGANASAVKSVAIGPDSRATVDGGVALGRDSVANVIGGITNKGYNPNTTVQIFILV